MAYDLDRFVNAQDAIYARVLHELRIGQKSGHWMWFIFPQLRALGRSQTSLYYGVSSQDEAAAYLAHDLLGSRLRECTALTCDIRGKSIGEIFGDVDAMKFRSSMTLFAAATADNELFLSALDIHCGGLQDPATIAALRADDSV